MSIIKSHDITLYGGNDIDIVLRPLSDEHLPLLYKWNSDPLVLYWTEGGTADLNLSYDTDTVHCIYGGDIENILYFLIEVDNIPIGECWLQKMNLPNVKSMYPDSLDVRRIDMSIGEKEYWNKGIGTQFIGMMIDFAFNGEYVDVLHCFCEDYNIRSRRMWEKHNFKRILEEPLTPQPQKGKWQYHYTLTRQEFINNRRDTIPIDKKFIMPIVDLQPSQLYISEGKLRLLKDWFNVDDIDDFDPIPIKRLNNRTMMTDGHTRAVAAFIAGWDNVPVYWDESDLDMNAYKIDILWCHEDNIYSPLDLVNRIVSHKDYERLWRKRCMDKL